MVDIIEELKKYISIVFVLFFLSLNIINIGCIQNKAINNKDNKPINNKDYIYKKIQITSTIQKIDVPKIIHENESILLLLKKSDVKEMIKSDDCDTMCQSIMKRLESLNNSDCNFNDFDKREQYFYLRFVIADLLKSGQFILKEKKSDRIIKNITIGYYRWYKATLFGREGRLFLLPNGDVFYEITDILS